MPRSLIFLFALVSLVSLALAAAACGGDPTPTPVPPTRRPTRTPPPPATLKPPPTNPIPTATPLPTNTPEPSPTVTSVPATAVPVSNTSSGGSSAGSGLNVWTMAPLVEYFSRLGASTLPGIERAANVNPLTGLEVGNPANLQRRPVLARIGNDPSSREIHAGFNQADLVFEEMIDQRNMVFAVTRFTLVFYGQDAAFRPLRSARAVNASLMPMFDGILISSGGSKGTRFMLSQLPWFSRTLDGDLQNNTICIAPGDYRVRVASSVPHVQEYITSQGQNGAVNLRGFQFSDAPAGGSPAGVVAFDHGPWPIRSTGVIEWRFDAGSGKYLRFVNGAPHNTQSYALNGKWRGACAIENPQAQQIASSNVVVLNVKYEPTDFVEDTLNSYSAFIEMTGSGTAQIFRDGVKIDARWDRPTLTDFFRFTDANGAEIGLKPGNTWFELAPLGYAPTVK
jgi:hypothetical protein